MAANKISQCYVLFSLLGIFHVLPFVNSACLSPLGMENGNIKDSQITVSSAFFDSNAGGEARLRQNIEPWGSWCPNIEGGFTLVTKFDEYIQIDLLNLTKVTRVATQGRELVGGVEFVKEYKISYSRDGRTWIFYPGKNRANEAKIFQGNNDGSSVVVNDLNPTITVRYIRIHPGYRKWAVCMRLELYSCECGENEKVILSYSMPVGQGTKNGKTQYNDTSYTGVISNNFYKDGTGILTDGKFGPVNANEFQGKEWVGWSSDLTESQYIPIVFEFSDVRKFKDVTITVNVDKNRDTAVFNRSQILFSTVEKDFSNTSFLQYCPRIVPVNHDQNNTNITLPLCENTASFIKMKLYFGGKWLLISEISFNSVSASADEKQSLQKCSEDFLASCSDTGTSTTPRPTCKDCVALNTPKPGLVETTESSTTPIIVAVVVSVVILLIVVFGILEYKRRHKASQMTTSVSIPEETVELRPLDFVVEPSSNNQEAEHATSAVSDLDPLYEEVQLSPSVYTELDRNERGGIEPSDDNIYQKLLKQDSDHVMPADGETGYVIPADGETGHVIPAAGETGYVISADGETGHVIPAAGETGYVIPADDETESYEEVKLFSPSGYTELDKSKHDESTTNNADNYQKLLKQDPDYVMPDDDETGSYDDVKISTPPGYTELDKSKQDESTTNNADDYQKSLQYDPDSETPCGTEPYEEAERSKTLPGYKELDNTRRELDDGASYQKLIKK